MIGKKNNELKVERKDPNESTLSCVRQLFKKVVVRPLDFVCKATIPCCDEKHWSRKRASVNPFFGLLTFLIASQCKSFPPTPQYRARSFQQAPAIRPTLQCRTWSFYPLQYFATQTARSPHLLRLLAGCIRDEHSLDLYDSQRDRGSSNSVRHADRYQHCDSRTHGALLGQLSRRRIREYVDLS
jgi:hypothetical protein